MSSFNSSFRAGSPESAAFPEDPGLLRSLDTAAVRGAVEPDNWCGSLVTPLVQTTTYVQQGLGKHKGHAYSRVSNPTVDALERQLGALEGALPAVTFSSGLAAETALFLALLKSGNHAVVGGGCYGGTVRLFRQVLADLGIDATFVDTSDHAAVASAITPRTKLVFVETPSNPTLTLTDIEGVARVVKGANKDITLVVDNTFLTAVLLRPLDLGADVVVYSTTKHIEGHSAALGGAVTSRNEAMLERLRFIRKATGAIQTPWHAWLTSRGIKTLPLRIRQQSRNAQRIARWLQSRPEVARVLYPGLDSFPQRDLARRLHGEFHGGVVAFELVGGVPAGESLLNNVKLCALVEHVGSVETLLTHPATMTHADVPREQRLAAGITDGLVRLSVGLEDPGDVIDDLDRALGAPERLDAPGFVAGVVSSPSAPLVKEGQPWVATPANA
jgi:cystathionine beta-lyase/cystathionine gamma-synthase